MRIFALQIRCTVVFRAMLTALCLAPAALCLAPASLCLAPAALAGDYFLTVGGGYSPTGNQVSLEKNVLMFSEMLEESYPDATPHDILFSDGTSPGRDLQFANPDFQIPKVNDLLAQVFRQTRYQRLQYRDHEIPNVRAATSKTALGKWFDEVGKNLVEGDRLFIYVTAHGGRSTDRKRPTNTYLYLWNNQRIAMSEFVDFLDRVPSAVPVVVVMVQCYSGGFADIVFEKGDRSKGASERNRCGFFATVHDRVAAGCTADINEANYQEYSSYFWAALRGKDRLGRPVEGADFDQDNRVSFTEAHGYALLESSTIDVSICTSDAFLRAHSRLAADEKKGDDKENFLTIDAPYSQLLELATPTERAVMEGLSTQLGLEGDDRVQRLKVLAKELANKKQEADKQRQTKDKELTGVCRSISNSLRNRWPEFANRWHPAVDGLLQTDGDAIATFIEKHPLYKRMGSVTAEVQEFGRQKLDLDREWAKTQRLLRTMENVVLTANLPRVADETSVGQFRKLRDAESQHFGVKP